MLLVTVAWCQLALFAFELVRVTSVPLSLASADHLYWSHSSAKFIFLDKSFYTSGHFPSDLWSMLASASIRRKLLQYAESQTTEEKGEHYLEPHQYANYASPLDLSLSQVEGLDGKSVTSYMDMSEQVPFSTATTFHELQPSTLSSDLSSADNEAIIIPSLNDITNGELVFRLLGAIFCILIILCTIVGNVLVIIVVTRFHRMRTVTNILLAR